MRYEGNKVRMMTTQMQFQGTPLNMEPNQQKSTQSRINQQKDALTKAIERILSLRKMTSESQKK